MQQTDACATQPFASLKRRDLLRGIGAGALIAGSGAGAGALLAETATTSAPPPAFVTVSRFVTGSDLTDDAAIARAWTELTALDATFAAALVKLDGAIRGASLKTMAEYLASPLAQDAALTKTATTIVSAFYLGFTGTPIEHRVKDDTGFVTFVGALMWRPTIDMTIIPTFARGKTDWWVAPPAGIPTPSGKPGQPDWQGSSPSPISAKA